MGDSKSLRKLLFGLCLIAIIVLLGLFVWPTLYRYERYRDIIVRFNRVSGKVQLLSDKGWITLERPPERWEPLDTKDLKPTPTPDDTKR